MGCGCGLIGSLVISPGSQSPVYSNAIPRGGEAAVFSAEVLEFDAAGDVEIVLQHKNKTDASFSTLQTIGQIGSTGIQTVYVTGLKEVVRVMAQFGVGSSSAEFFRLANINWAWFAYA